MRKDDARLSGSGSITEIAHRRSAPDGESRNKSRYSEITPVAPLGWVTESELKLLSYSPLRGRVERPNQVVPHHLLEAPDRKTR